METFITSSRRPWYRKKRFIIPICLSTILVIAAVILGSVLGTRTNIKPTGNFFGIFSLQRWEKIHSAKMTQFSGAHMFKPPETTI
jgi:uncharacterized membrane protein